MDFVISTGGVERSRAYLRRHFYKANRWIEERWDGSRKAVIAKPIGFYHETKHDDEYYIISYYRSYIVRIEPGNSVLNGPHKVFLQLIIPSLSAPVWLGTAQFDGNFYDEKNIRIQLRQAIEEKQYYCGSDSLEEMIEVEPAKDLISESCEPDRKIKIKKRGVGKKLAYMRYPKWNCPICKKKCKDSRLARRHFRIRHPKFHLVIWHKSSGATGF